VGAVSFEAELERSNLVKSVINKGIQELVEAKFGAEAWENVKTLAGCEEPFCAISFVLPLLCPPHHLTEEFDQ
jgi:hypothetical protein